MQRWGNIKVGEKRQRTYVLPQSMLDKGITIDISVTPISVAVTQPAGSAVTDPTPQSLYVTSSAALNAAPFTDKGRVVQIAQAVVITLQPTVMGADYVVSLSFKLSTGEIFCIDLQQSVTQYVTTP